MEKQSDASLKMPENFRSIIVDFVSDLSITFPEYTQLWSKWGDSQLPESELERLFHYVLGVFPGSFFDIVYQNDDIFNPESEKKVNTAFLIDVEFKLLFNAPGVSETTRKTIWKYLQLILFTILGSVNNKSVFGDSMNMFEDVNEEELNEKLQETMSGLSDFFMNLNSKMDDEPEQPTEAGHKEESDDEQMPNLDEFTEQAEKMFGNLPNMGGLPNMGAFKKAFDFEKMKNSLPKPEEINAHLKKLFDGKIGQLAKELAEEVTSDLTGLFGEDDGSVHSTKDVFAKLMKNPKKMMELVKIISNKLNKKMKSGDISQEDLMKEASELFSTMKGMGDNSEEFKDVLKTMMSTFSSMGGLGKNMRMDTNAMNNQIKKNSIKERLRERLEKKRQMQAMAETLKKSAAPASAKPENFVFRIDGETQERSARPMHSNNITYSLDNDDDIDKIVNELQITNDDIANPNKDASAKKKKKKSKK